MKKRITKTQRNKIVHRLINSNNKIWEKLSNLLYSGDINFGDTFGFSYDEYDDDDITFVINSACGCLGDANLTEKQAELFTLLELAR